MQLYKFVLTGHPALIAIATYHLPPTRPFQFRSLRTVVDCADRAARLLDAIGIPYSVAYGATLGLAVYKTGLVPWDHDVDFVIANEDVQALRVSSSRWASVPEAKGLIVLADQCDGPGTRIYCDVTDQAADLDYVPPGLGHGAKVQPLCFYRREREV